MKDNFCGKFNSIVDALQIIENLLLDGYWVSINEVENGKFEVWSK